jgi:hypothetical protein
MHHVTCPRCGVSLRVGPGMGGIKAQCNQCSTVFIVPITAAPGIPPALSRSGDTRPGSRYGDDYEEFDVDRSHKGSSALLITLVVVGLLLLMGAGAGVMIYLTAQPVTSPMTGVGPASTTVPVATKTANPVEGGGPFNAANIKSETYTVFLSGDPAGVKPDGYNTRDIFLQANSTITIRVSSELESNINLIFNDANGNQIVADTTPGKNCYLQTTVFQDGNYSIMVDNLGPGNNRCHITYDVSR